MNTYAPEDEILARGHTDWIHFAEALWLVNKWSSARGLHTRSELIRALRSLLSEGLIEIGTVSKDAGFRPWALTEDQIIDRVLEQCDSGQLEIPVDGHQFSRPADTGSPGGRTGFFFR